jgi:hypothetical protein
MRQIKITAPFENYQAGDTPTVLGSVGRQLVGLGVAEWIIEAGPASSKAPIKTEKKVARRARK